MPKTDWEDKYRIYLGQGYDEDQLLEIKLGLQDGVDVSRYASVTMPANDMAYQRKLLNYDKAKMEPKQNLGNIKITNNTEKKDKYLSYADVAITVGEISVLIAGIVVILIKLHLI